MSQTNIIHKGLIPAPKALQLVLEDAGPNAFETVKIEEAAYRILATDLSAKRTQPPFNASAMDGYAFRHQDISKTNTSLKLIGESAAGHAFDGKVEKGHCTRIFTGAPLPHGTDSVVIQENTQQLGDQIKLLNPPDKGANVRQAGIDFSKGDILLKKGTILDAECLSLAASMNHDQLPVWSKPEVCVLSTGDELVLPGQQPGPSQIIASNSFGICAIANAAGAHCKNLGIASDTMDAHISKIGSAIDGGADLIVTIGGASVGDHDLVKPAIEHFGFQFQFVKIAIRPGKPVMFAKAIINGKLRRFLGLPGNPVSSLVTAHMFMRPLIRKLSGYPANSLKPVPALLEEALPENGDREDYMRATSWRDDKGQYHVKAFTRQDSSMLSTMAKSDCLLIRPIKAPKAEPGDVVPIVLLHDG